MTTSDRQNINTEPQDYILTLTLFNRPGFGPLNPPVLGYPAYPDNTHTYTVSDHMRTRPVLEPK